MLYGVLNTHKYINDLTSQFFSMPKLLIRLQNENIINLNIFIYTEDKCFFKWTPLEKISDNTVYDYKIIDTVEDRYIVCQYDSQDIKIDLDRIYGDKLKSLIVLEDAYNKEFWSSSKEPYQKSGTSNRWRNTMITEFLDKKKKSVQLVEAYSANEKISYDAYIIARPDSEIPRQYDPEIVMKNMNLILQEVKSSSSAILFFDKCNLNDSTFKMGSSPGMMANDFAIGNYQGIKAKVSLIDEINNSYKGNYFSIYSELAIRCGNCFHLQIYDKKPSICPICKRGDMVQVSEWPEYKMYSHLLNNTNVKLQPLPFKGKVVR